MFPSRNKIATRAIFFKIQFIYRKRKQQSCDKKKKHKKKQTRIKSELTLLKIKVTLRNYPSSLLSLLGEKISCSA